MFEDTRYYYLKNIKKDYIFVSIASYRDIQCQWTIKELFDKAVYPERVIVGVCFQHDPEEDQDCFTLNIGRPNQIKMLKYHCCESYGCGWARSQAEMLWQGEEYILQIDSHMRFNDRWDVLMIDELNKCQSDKPFLTTYPHDFILPNTRTNHGVVIIKPGHFNDKGMMVWGSRVLNHNSSKDPYPTLGYSAAFNFSTYERLFDVPYDPYIYFWGEESSMAVRLWTNGWDLFCPSIPLTWHIYAREYIKGKMHWDNHKEWWKNDDLSFKRVHSILDPSFNIHKTMSEVKMYTEDLLRYQLGNSRTLDEYQRHFGVNFRTKVIDEWSKEGMYHIYKK